MSVELQVAIATGAFGLMGAAITAFIAMFKSNRNDHAKVMVHHEVLEGRIVGLASNVSSMHADVIDTRADVRDMKEDIRDHGNRIQHLEESR